MSTMNSYSTAWAQRLHQRRDDLEHVLAMDRFARWETSSMPESVALQELSFGLGVLFGGDESMGEKFIERSLNICNRIIDEDKLLSDRCRDAYPINLAETLVVRGHSLAILKGRMDCKSFEEAVSHFHDGATTDHMQDKANLVWSARILLILGCLDEAISVLESINQEQSLCDPLGIDWLNVARTVASGQDEIVKDVLSLLFEEKRNPTLSATGYGQIWIGRLELSLIIQRYLKSPLNCPDWRAAIRDFSA